MLNLKKYSKYKTPVLMAGALFLLYKLSNSTQSNKDTSELINEESEAAEAEGITLSYPLSNYNIWADSLQAAMFDAGTDESVIYNVFNKLKNPRDLLQLIKAFGVRPYYTFGWKQGNYNLGQWFTEELSTSEFDKINAILKSKNINIQF